MRPALWYLEIWDLIGGNKCFQWYFSTKQYCDLSIEAHYTIWIYILVFTHYGY